MVRAGLERFGAAFGRFERIPAGDRTILLLLVKNPAGANEVVHTLLEGGAPSLLLVALNDAIADGKDVSWIWDVDLEPLLSRTEMVTAPSEKPAVTRRKRSLGDRPFGVRTSITMRRILPSASRSNSA